MSDRVINDLFIDNQPAKLYAPNIIAGLEDTDEITQLQNDIAAETTRAEGEEARIEALFTAPTQEAVDNWLDEHPEATTTVQDGAITLAKLHPDVRADVEDISSIKENLSDVTDVLYEYTSVPVNQTRNNAKLEDSGLYSSTTAYKAVMFPVVEGQILKVVSPYKFQFQTVNTAPSSGDSIRVGDTTYGDGTFKVTVPTGAKYVAVSVLKADTPTVSIVSNKFEAQTERLLSDEEIVLLLASAKDDIREINLNADFFQSGYSSRRTQLKVFNPTTLKGMFPATPSADIYDNIDIGLRTLYLTKGDKVITNIDAIYDNSKLHIPNQPFNNNGYYGVILSMFQANNDTDNGSVYYGREAFDGKWRVLDIDVTGYYELSFRQDVSYTNKAYIWHQHKTLVDRNDIIADITDDLQFHDGLVTYNAVTGWGGNEESNIGTSGKYGTKTVMLPDLSDYVGKSVLISGLDMYSSAMSTPAVVYYDAEDPTTPTTYYLTHLGYVYESNDYCAFPVLDGYNMRLQFDSHACLPFVRVWIVDNDTLFRNGLANPVFYGKKILGYGDSYIAGQGITNTWYYRIALRNVCEYVNRGHGGAGLCYGANGSLITSGRISELDEDADIYFLCFGRNDNSVDIAIGNNDDYPNTSATWDSAYLLNHVSFKAGMNYLFEYLESRHPYAKIVTVTPWGFENNAGVTSGLSCLDYIDAMQEMSKKWGITCFNAAGDVGIHVRIEAFRTQYFLASNDQSHLNNDGHALMAKRATKLLTNLLYDD